MENIEISPATPEPAAEPKKSVTSKVTQTCVLMVLGAKKFAKWALVAFVVTILVSVIAGIAGAPQSVKTAVPYGTDTGMYRRWQIATDQNKFITGEASRFGGDGQLSNVQLHTSDGKVYTNPATTSAGGPNKWVGQR